MLEPLLANACTSAKAMTFELSAPICPLTPMFIETLGKLRARKYKAVVSKPLEKRKYASKRRDHEHCDVIAERD